jgi:hypothetical protein
MVGSGRRFFFSGAEKNPSGGRRDGFPPLSLISNSRSWKSPMQRATPEETKERGHAASIRLQ